MTSAELEVPENRPDPAATPFDYSVLAPDVAEEMHDRADPIHNIRQASVLGVGRELIAAKRRDEHGFFPAWGRVTPMTSQPDLDGENDE